MTGWRIGYMLAPGESIGMCELINEAIIYSAPSVSQRCALYALKDYKRLKEKIVPVLKKSRVLLQQN